MAASAAPSTSRRPATTSTATVRARNPAGTTPATTNRPRDTKNLNMHTVSPPSRPRRKPGPAQPFRAVVRHLSTMAASPASPDSGDIHPPPSPPFSLRRLLALYAILWLASLPLVLAFGDFSKLRVQLESLAYPALLLLMFTAPATRRLWRDTPRAPRYAAVFLLLFLVNAQLLNRGEITYPVPPWTMYAAKRPIALVYNELVGLRADGRETAMRVNRRVPATRAFLSILGSLLDRERAALAEDSPARAKAARADLEHLLREIGIRENMRRDQTPLIAVQLVHVRLEADGRPVRDKILASVAIPPATAPAP